MNVKTTLKPIHCWVSVCIKTILRLYSREKSVAELRGRFKPSWVVRVEGSMRDLFVQQARDRNLHHYHIGYRFYKSSSDQTYPGDVSDGIVHILVTTNQQTNETIHKLIKVCPHHNPFKLPVDRLVG